MSSVGRRAKMWCTCPLTESRMNEWMKGLGGKRTRQEIKGEREEKRQIKKYIYVQRKVKKRKIVRGN